MRLCIYEDSEVSWLEPLTLTRPVFALWCGVERLFERQSRQLAASEVACWIRPELIHLWQQEQPDQPVNDPDWLRQGATTWINGRWLPLPDFRLDTQEPHVGMMGEQIAYAVLPAGEVPTASSIDAWLRECRPRWPERVVSGVMFNYLWEVVDHNGKHMKQDGQGFLARNGTRPAPAHVAIQGPAERFLMAKDAVVEPFVSIDTRGGPVMIDQRAVVHSFSRLEGPCYIGKESMILGARLRANSTIGPCCRIGGEVESSIVQGHSNKYHEGFLGHSYVGEWVNLAAATQTSDLRNDYDVVRVTVLDRRIVTGQHKVGSFIGDHTKTGLAALLNTGSTIGAFAHLLPCGTLLPQVVPSFCQAHCGQLQEQSDLRKLFQTAARVMQRRGRKLTEAHTDFYYSLFDTTASGRRKTIHASELRRMRRSV